MERQSGASPVTWKRGVVAVVTNAEKFLVIRRSATVSAPLAVCFPGGGIEPGETEEETIVREMREELGLDIVPQYKIWTCTTPWGYHLAWWRVDARNLAEIRPDPNEVAEWFWSDAEQLLAFNELLESNRRFLNALAQGIISPLA